MRSHLSRRSNLGKWLSYLNFQCARNRTPAKKPAEGFGPDGAGPQLGILSCCGSTEKENAASKTGGIFISVPGTGYTFE
jgi:hypothetical protein